MEINLDRGLFESQQCREVEKVFLTQAPGLAVQRRVLCEHIVSACCYNFQRALGIFLAFDFPEVSWRDAESSIC